jgi:hypothetical protein
MAWMLLPAEHHGAFRHTYRNAASHAVDDDTWVRARGWALTLSLAFLAHSADNRNSPGSVTARSVPHSPSSAFPRPTGQARRACARRVC